MITILGFVISPLMAWIVYAFLKPADTSLVADPKKSRSTSEVYDAYVPKDKEHDDYDDEIDDKEFFEEN